MNFNLKYEYSFVFFFLRGWVAELRWLVLSEDIVDFTNSSEEVICAANYTRIVYRGHNYPDTVSEGQLSSRHNEDGP